MFWKNLISYCTCEVFLIHRYCTLEVFLIHRYSTCEVRLIHRYCTSSHKKSDFDPLMGHKYFGNCLHLDGSEKS